MSTKILTGKPLVNIVRTEIVTEETTPKTYRWETASKANVKPEVSAGKEEILRIKNTIHATDRTEDIVVGYNIEFEDNVFTPEVFALVDGGELTYEVPDPLKPEEKVLKKYEAAESGKAVTRTPFTLNVYTEEKDTDGGITGYAKFTYLHCKGKPVEYEIEDGKFVTSKLEVTSRPKRGEKPVTIDFLNTLPV